MNTPRSVLTEGTYTMRLISIEMPAKHKKIWKVKTTFLDQAGNTHPSWVFIAAHETAWLLFHGLCALKDKDFAVVVAVLYIDNTTVAYNTIHPDWTFGPVELWQGAVK